MSGDNPKLIQVGRKTQTRRVADVRAGKYGGMIYKNECFNLWELYDLCPYGVAGDRLWVRETFTVTRYTYGASVASLVRLRGCYGDGNEFNVTLSGKESLRYRNWKKKTGNFPSIFMFRSLTRLTLEILNVRVEWLQDISYEDCVAEGIPRRMIIGHADKPKDVMIATYATLWDSLHGKGEWDKNPWVWTLEFKRQ